jgi:hypothetical protein
MTHCRKFGVIVGSSSCNADHNEVVTMISGHRMTRQPTVSHMKAAIMAASSRHAHSDFF